MKVELTYFKPTGKYYTTGEYETDKEHMFEIFREVREMLKARRLPGLVEGHGDYIVSVSAEHERPFPALIHELEFKE